MKTEQAMNIESYNTAITTQKAINSKSVALAKAWERWFKKLSWSDLNIFSATEREAEKMYHEYTVANARDKEEAKRIKHYNETGDAHSFATKAPKKKKPVNRSNGTIRRGDTGDAVKSWQLVIGLPVDGKFGPMTHKKTVAWQKSRGLEPDGIVGPLTWAAANNPKGTTASVVSPIITPITQVYAKAAESIEFVPLWQKIAGGFVLASFAFMGIDSLKIKRK